MPAGSCLSMIRKCHVDQLAYPFTQLSPSGASFRKCLCLNHNQSSGPQPSHHVNAEFDPLLLSKILNFLVAQSRFGVKSYNKAEYF